MMKRSAIKVGERFREDYGDIDRLAESISMHGMLQSVCVDKGYNLLAGGRRIAAADKVGLKTIPARILDTADPLVARQVELEENLERKDMTWEEEVKAKADIDALMKQLHGDQADTHDRTSWSQAKTAAMVGEHPSNLGRDLDLARALKVMPELAEAKTKHEARKMLKRMSEDLAADSLRRRIESVDEDSAIKRASNHYKIGDAMEGLKEIADPSIIAFAEVDPPYGIDLAKAKWRTNSNEEISADRYTEVEAGEYGEFIRSYTKELYRVLAPHAWCVWWFGPTYHTLVQSALRDAGFEVDDIPCVWVKGYGQSKRPEIHLGRSYEPFFCCRKGHPALARPGRLNTFAFSPVAGQSKVHATERPLPMMVDIVQTFMQPGQVAIVPFLGSGVTLRALYKHGCVGWGWDKSDNAEELKGKFLAKVIDDFAEREDND